MNSRYSHLQRFFFTSIDLLALNVVHMVMMRLLQRIPANAERHYLYLFFATNTIWLLSAYSTALYINNDNDNKEKFLKRTFKTFIVFNVLMLLFMFVYQYPYSRLFMLASFTTYLGFLVFTRLILIVVSFYKQKLGKANKKIVILGYNDMAKTLVKSLASQRMNFHVAGFFEDANGVTELSALPIIGNIDECLEYARCNEIDEIYSTISPEKNTRLYEMVKVAENSFIRFKFVPDFRVYVNRITHMEYLAEIPVLSLRPEPLEDAGNAIKKRIFDVLFSLLVIVILLSWLVPLIAILIKLSSRGPVFFAQMRSGKNNQEFKCFKFRTLKVNAEANTIQVTRDDNRITFLGRFLRKSNLDELPQFVNVLFGDMSVVGPRPHMLRHTRKFSKILEEYMIRHFVKPGVTGWAQVNGYRGEIREDEQLRKRFEYDIWYMENWSLWLDMKIIWLTIRSMISGDENAY